MNQQLAFDMETPAAVILSPPVIKLKRLARSDAQAGRAMGHQGAELAAAAADSQHEGWKVAALSFFLDYGRAHGGEFMTEDVRHASKGHVPQPKNPRSWGHVALAAKKAGQIEFARFDTSNDPKSHGAPSNVWRWIGANARTVSRMNGDTRERA